MPDSRPHRRSASEGKEFRNQQRYNALVCADLYGLLQDAQSRLDTLRKLQLSMEPDNAALLQGHITWNTSVVRVLSWLLTKYPVTSEIVRRENASSDSPQS